MNNKHIKLSIIAVSGVLSLALLTTCFEVVKSGHVGVKTVFGAVSLKPLEEGFHCKKPWEDIVEVDTRISKGSITTSAGSKDLQTVATEVTLQYSINGLAAPLIHQRVGSKQQVERSIIAPAIQESLKAITAKYTASELITLREEVKSRTHITISKFIEKTLSERGIESGVHIANVAITDFSFSSKFSDAIEQKVKANQEALKAQKDKEKRITEAEAEYEERRLKADAVAYETTKVSKARAEAIKREAKALESNPELVQLRIAEKWDGKLPQFNGGGATPLLSLGDLTPKP